MNIVKVVSSHRFLSCLFGVVVIQLAVVIWAVGLHYFAPTSNASEARVARLNLIEQPDQANSEPKAAFAFNSSQTSELSQPTELGEPTEPAVAPEEVEALPEPDLSEETARVQVPIEEEVILTEESESEQLAPTTQTPEQSQDTQSQDTPVEQVGFNAKHTVVAGDTLTKIWTSNGGTYAGGVLAAKALEQVQVKLSSIRAGEEIELFLAETGDITRFKKKLRGGKVVILEGSSANGYKARIISPKILQVKRTATGTITGSFFSSAVESGVPHDVIDNLVDLFSTRLEFRRDVQPGDSFAVIYTERSTDKGEKLSPGPIVAASLSNKGELFAAVRHEDKDGVGRYYDETGGPLGNYFLRYPLRFSRISSAFSKSRFHPVLKRRRAHNGVDFAAPIGTPVRAVADGVVTTAGHYGGNGKMVKLRHGSRYDTAYLHLSKISAGIKRGARVTRGQIIGKVGMTGLATGPHLHYSLYDKGRYVDPLKVKLPQMPVDLPPIPAGYLKATLRTLKLHHETIRIASISSDSATLG